MQVLSSQIPVQPIRHKYLHYLVGFSRNLTLSNNKRSISQTWILWIIFLIRWWFTSLFSALQEPKSQVPNQDTKKRNYFISISLQYSKFHSYLQRNVIKSVWLFITIKTPILWLCPNNKQQVNIYKVQSVN